MGKFKIEGLPEGEEVAEGFAVEGLPAGEEVSHAGQNVQPQSGGGQEQPGLIDLASGGFLGRDVEKGVTLRNLAEEAGRYGPRAIGGILGAAAGAPGGPPSMAAGAFAGGAAAESLRGVQRQLAHEAGYDVPGLTPEQAVRLPIEAGAEEAAGVIAGPTTEKLASKAVSLPATVGKGIFRRASETISRIAPEALDRAIQRPAQVLGQAATEAGETAAAHAELFRAAINENMARASKAYQEMTDLILGDAKYGEGYTIDVFKGMGDDMAEILRDLGMGDPQTLLPDAPRAAFRETTNKLSQMRNISVRQLWRRQKEINKLVRQHTDAHGKVDELGLAYMRLRDSMRKLVGETVPEISVANKVFAKAKDVEKKAAKAGLTKAKDLPSRIATAYRRHTTDRKVLEEIASEVPAAREALEAMRDALAAKHFPGVAPLVPTGLTGAMGIGAVRAGEGSAPAMVGAAMTAPFVFPKLIGRTAAAGAKLAERFARTGIPAAAKRASESAAGRQAARSVSARLFRSAADTIRAKKENDRR